MPQKKSGARRAQWRVHTPRLLQEIGINPNLGILKVPLNLLARQLADVAKRAIELNDPELNVLMMRLTLYDQADPYSDNYDAALCSEMLGSAEIAA